MNSDSSPTLAAALTDLSHWTGPTGELWAAALERAESQAPPTRSNLVANVFTRRVPWQIVACVGIAAVFVPFAFFASGAFDAARHHAKSATTAGPGARLATLGTGTESELATADRARGFIGGVEPADGGSFGRSAHFTMNLNSDGPRGGRAAEIRSSEEPSTQSADRHVIRKATIELAVPDVRAVFLKIGMLVRDAGGEFVQDSALTGEERSLQGNITLRVSAQRLAEVLNELRDLGKVQAERVEGQDVTGQVVDIESRLRNERRVEAELLELLDSRKDAPLKDVLELRAALSSVRDAIEQLVGQRDRLGNLVGLATVLIIIRPTDAPPPPSDGLGAYFFNSLSQAWTSGLRLLSDTAAGLVQIAVAGLIWWIVLAIIIIALRRAWLRAGEASAHR